MAVKMLLNLCPHVHPPGTPNSTPNVFSNPDQYHRRIPLLFTTPITPTSIPFLASSTPLSISPFHSSSFCFSQRLLARPSSVSSLPIQRRPHLPTFPDVLAKKSGGSKRSKKRPAKPAKTRGVKPSDSNSSQQPLTNTPSLEETVQSQTTPTPSQMPSPPSDVVQPPITFPGPLAPEVLQMDDAIPPQGQLSSQKAAPSEIDDVDGYSESEGNVGEVITGEGGGDGLELGDIPIASEARLKLPELNTQAKSIRRKRKPRARKQNEQMTSAASSSVGDGNIADVPWNDGADGILDSSAGKSISDDSAEKRGFSVSTVRDLVRAYRLGEDQRQDLIDELEKEPDFVMQSDAPGGEYDLASAIFGRGQPNKQGIYVLPYVQSATLVIIAVASLIAFVYYPGFPLTEAPEEIREAIRVVLAAYFTVNVALASLAYKGAGKRGQPKVFWAMKTLMLGEVAYGELRRNTTILHKGSAPRKGKKKM